MQKQETIQPLKQGQLQIHSQNILPIIKKWLYSEKDIFVRELVSNACDAIQKVTILQSRGEITNTEERRIDITQDAQAKTLTFSDTGIGMTAAETEKYLAQIAFSGAEEFIKAYQAQDPFIGHFGLGFYSAYMVADRVQVNTRSHQGDETGVVWTSDGISGYEICAAPKEKPGTDVVLYVSDENEEYLDEKRLKAILQRNCSFLPYPIYLNGQRINEHEPLWLKNPSECTKEEYLAFFKALYPFEAEPLFWVHIRVDYPFQLRGILYFPSLNRETNIKKNQVKLFCNRVFVSDDCKDILPEYLSILQGAIDSPDIPLNVSRSYLQVDKNVRQLSDHIVKKVADALCTLYKQDRTHFFECWKDCELIVKFGILHDEKFYAKVKEILVWKTLSQKWLTTEEYIEMHRSKAEGVVFYTTSPQVNDLTKLYAARDIEIVEALGYLDHAVISFLERQLKNVRFTRIDAAENAHILDASKEKTILDESGRTEAAKIADFIRTTLQKPGCDTITIDAKSLASDTIPAVLILSEEGRRFREYLQHQGKDAPSSFPISSTFIANTNSPLINAIYALRLEQPELASDLVQKVYALTRLSQHEMSASEIGDFTKECTQMFEKLTSLILKK